MNRKHIVFLILVFYDVIKTNANADGDYCIEYCSNEKQPFINQSDFKINSTLKCNETGLQQDTSDTTCKKYYLCLLIDYGMYYRKDFICPDGTWYNPELNHCTPFYYDCSKSNEFETLPNIDDECKEEGHFKETNDYTCTKYYSCLLLENGKLIKTEHRCQEGFAYDETINNCSASYQCPQFHGDGSDVITGSRSVTTSTATTAFLDNVNSCEIIENSTLICSQSGHFRKSNDLSCTQYYQCSQLTNGSYIRTEYNCPYGAYFNPILQKCDTFYVCPCDISIATISTDSGASINPARQSCEVGKHVTFQCKKRGRYTNPNDITCTNYYLCSLLRNGSFIQTEYSCPHGSYFDPALQKCSISYSCPCITTTKHANPTSTTTMKSPTTLNPCQNHEEDKFTCNKRGRFRKPNDPTCAKYYLCSLLRNGSFIQTEYDCPDRSYFDPALQKCSISYSCPCISTTKTVTPTSIITKSFTTLNPCQNDEEDEFTCNERGRFRKPNDLTCTKYYLCSLLRNGSFIQTEYGCPAGSYFDPSLHMCSELYKCPCTTSTSTITTTTTASTTTQSSTTLNPCQNDEEDEFTCSERGRFRKPNDLTCTKYYLCSLLRNGSFIQTEYGCPDGSYFDPALQKCSLSYSCPCVSTTKAVTPTSMITKSFTTLSPCSNDEEDEFTCNERGRFRKPNDLTCTKYYLCSLLRNGSFIQTEYGCPDGSHFDPALQTCSISYSCPCRITTKPASSTSTTTTTQSSTTLNPCQNDEEGKLTCNERGRFRKPNDLTCTKYYLCSLLRNGSFIQTEYGCPDGSYFDPALQKCSISYSCPCTTTSIPSTVTQDLTTLQPYSTEDSSTFACTELGQFREPTDLSCTKYYLCKLSDDGLIIHTLFNCLEGSYFDPNLQRCSNVYNCPWSVTTTTALHTTAAEISTTLNPCAIIKDEGFTCTESGRFRKPNDLTCTKYYVCTQLLNGVFIRTEYLCPDGSFFYPQLKICSTYYTCPCTVSEPQFPYMLPIVVDKSVLKETEIAPVPLASNKCETNENSKFICTKNGRFRKPNDQTCKQYYYCELLGKHFQHIEYSCPSGTLFDPSLMMCSRKYLCPCNDATKQSFTDFIKTELFPFWVLL